jgi:hypothetical protein
MYAGTGAGASPPEADATPVRPAMPTAANPTPARTVRETTFMRVPFDRSPTVAGDGCHDNKPPRKRR